MAYYNNTEPGARVQKVKKILERLDLDFAFVYYDEFNVANGWYITAWCPQFESGAVLIPREGEPMILGGPESEPFAKQDSAVRETRNLPVFMVPDEEYPNAKIESFANLFSEISHGKRPRRAGIVGADQMPVSVYRQVKENFTGVDLIDITDEFLKLRQIKSPWEIEQIRKAFLLADFSYEAMKEQVRPYAKEYEAAAAGEAAARTRGASGFAFKTIVGSGKRSNAVVPTAMDKVMRSGEMVMLGISPRWNGYSSVFGDTLPVSGKFTSKQLECYKHLQEVMRLTKEMLVPGKTGREIDAPGRAYFEKIGYSKYLVCPFAHTIGLMEAEAPFFGPNSSDILRPGMTVCIDISIFGHPDLNGLRIETGYEITDNGAVPFSKKMDRILLG
jgi:Xaa-Pro aminopeptidase